MQFMAGAQHVEHMDILVYELPTTQFMPGAQHVQHMDIQVYESPTMQFMPGAQHLTLIHGSVFSFIPLFYQLLSTLNILLF